MPALTIAFALLFYAAAALLCVGLILKIVQYSLVKAPLKIVVTPAPVTRLGVALRMVQEVVFFRALFFSNKWTWLFGWTFHVCLALTLARHLRYFQSPVWASVVAVQSLGQYAALAMAPALLGLWARRVWVDRVRFISTPSDHLHLALLLCICVSGLAMRFVAHTDIVALKAFMLGLMRLDWQPLPTDPLLLLHLALVAALMVIFPVSKLLHAPGLFFSPARNQADNARERRHVSAWAASLKN